MTDNEIPYYPYPTLSREEASNKLVREVNRFFEDYHLSIFARKSPNTEQKFRKILENTVLGENTPSLRRQIIAPAGIGKTQAVISNLHKCYNMNIWFMVPNHTLAQELAQRIEKTCLGVDVYPVKGRREDTCQRSGIANQIGSKGINVQKSLCENGEIQCEYFNSCKFQEQRKLFEQLKLEDESNKGRPVRVFVMAHNYLVLNSGIPSPDLVIVDETHWKTFIENQALGYDDLRSICDKELDYSESYKELVDCLINAFQEYPENFLAQLKKKNISFGKPVEYVQQLLNAEKYIDLNPSKSDASIKNQVSSWNYLKLLKIKKLLEILSFEIEKGKVISSISIDAEASKPIQINSTKQNMISKNTPVLLIDASASEDINNKIWGKSLQTVEIRADRNCEIIQVSNRTFSKKSLGIPYNDRYQPEESEIELQQETIRFVNQIAKETAGDVLLITYKSAKEIFKPHLESNVLIDHLGDIRGSNAYEHCETVIILGRLQPNVKDINNDTLALLSHNDRNLMNNHLDNYSTSTRNVRMKDGSTIFQKMYLHHDPTAQKVLEQIREREIEQALDRIRLIHGDKKKAYLLTNIPCDVTIDKLVKWKDLTHNTKMDKAILRALEKGKAFTLSDTDLARLHPDIWASRDAVKGYIKRHGGIKWVVSLIRYYIPNDPLFEVQYRYKNQRRWSKAIVAGENKDFKDALESYLQNSLKIGGVVKL